MQENFRSPINCILLLASRRNFLHPFLPFLFLPNPSCLPPCESQPSVFLACTAPLPASSGKLSCLAADHVWTPPKKGWEAGEEKKVSHGRLIICWMLFSSLHRHEEATQSSGTVAVGKEQTSEGPKHLPVAALPGRESNSHKRLVTALQKQ